MTTIAAGASNTVTLAQGSTLKTTGTGTAVFGPGPQANMQIGLQGANAIGPFQRDQVLYISATTQVDYSVTANLATLPAARIVSDPSGNSIGIVGPDRKIITPNSAVRVAFFGDSITQQSMSCWLSIAAQPADNFGSQGFIVYGMDWSTPAGAGTLTYDQTTKTLQWAPFGLTAGPATDASVTGILYIPGPAPDTGLWLSWFGKARAYTSGSTTVTAQANGQQRWNWNAYGFPVQAMAYAGQRFTWAKYAGLPMGLACYGMSSGRINDLVDSAWQWSSIVSDVDVIAIGTNSCSAGYPNPPMFSVSQMIADLKTFIDMRRAVTPLVIVCTIPPKGSSAETVAMHQQRAAVNAWIFDYCKNTPGVIPFDLNALVSEPTTGYYITGYSYDTVHPANLGAQPIGYTLAQLMLSLFPAQSSVYLPGFFDTYDATYNPYGNMLSTQGMSTFEGSGGTASTGAAGVVPTGYTLTRDTGAAMTLTGSKVARTDGTPGNWYQVVLAGALATEAGSLRTGSINSAVAGDIVEALLEVNVASSSLLSSMHLNLVPAGVSGRTASAFQASSLVHKDSMGKLWLRTMPFTVPAGATSVTPYINMGTQNGGSATIQLGRLIYRKVRPEF